MGGEGGGKMGVRLLRDGHDGWMDGREEGRWWAVAVVRAAWLCSLPLLSVCLACSGRSVRVCGGGERGLHKDAGFRGSWQTRVSFPCVI